jgi:hypothetical protein
MTSSPIKNKPRRRVENKIYDIKAVRLLTSFLGKATRIPSCYRSHYDPGVTSGPFIQQVFGWGLKESKDYVEMKYDYYNQQQETPQDRDDVRQFIHKVKRTRQVMSMLRKLKLQSPNESLTAAKEFVERIAPAH